MFLSLTITIPGNSRPENKKRRIAIKKLPPLLKQQNLFIFSIILGLSYSITNGVIITHVTSPGHCFTKTGTYFNDTVNLTTLMIEAITGMW